MKGEIKIFGLLNLANLLTKTITVKSVKFSDFDARCINIAILF